MIKVKFKYKRYGFLSVNHFPHIDLKIASPNNQEKNDNQSHKCNPALAYSSLIPQNLFELEPI